MLSFDAFVVDSADMIQRAILNYRGNDAHGPQLILETRLFGKRPVCDLAICESFDVSRFGLLFANSDFRIRFRVQIKTELFRDAVSVRSNVNNADVRQV
jgi:hypothetical protein